MFEYWNCNYVQRIESIVIKRETQYPTLQLSLMEQIRSERCWIALWHVPVSVSTVRNDNHYSSKIFQNAFEVIEIGSLPYLVQVRSLQYWTTLPTVNCTGTSVWYGNVSVSIPNTTTSHPAGGSHRQYPDSTSVPGETVQDTEAHHLPEL